MTSEKMLTVLMPVYNGETYLEEAVQSILDQTYGDFHFLIIDDGSTDRSPDILRSFAEKDSRIEVRTQQNKGIIDTLNDAITSITTPFIARMDADDIALPHRIETQMAFLDEHPEVGACGSWIQAIGHPLYDVIKYYGSHEEICINHFQLIAFAHPTVMFRTSVVVDNELKFDHAFLHVEDYQMWHELSKVTRLANIKEVLLKYRFHEEQISSTKKDIQNEHAKACKKGILGDFLGREVSEEEFHMHLFLVHNGPFVPLDFEVYLTWMTELYEANEVSGYFDKSLLVTQLTQGLYKVALECAKSSPKVASQVASLPFFNKRELTRSQLVRLRIKAILRK